MKMILIYFAKKYKGDWDAIYKALDKKEKVSLDDLIDLEEELKVTNQNVITILDIDYPSKLKESYKPPFVLFYAGDKTLLKDKVISVTGDEVDKQTQERIKKFVPEIAISNTIATSDRRGAEEVINKASPRKPKIVVLASGLDKHKNITTSAKDLFISEYPLGKRVTKETTRSKDRLTAAISDSLILFSSEKEGSLVHLVTNFLNLGKEIYCFPGNGDAKDGNSELIKQGANMITGVRDLSN